MKHTEKPWEIIRRDDNSIVVVTTKCDGVSDICEINVCLLECDANANLIVMAPQLLESLKEMAEMAMHAPLLGHNYDQGHIDKANSVIFNAEKQL